MAWNREHAGVAAAPAVAIDWSVTAMTEAAGRLTVAAAWDLPRLAAAAGEAVWWVTLVDATLVRYHPQAYEKALSSNDVRRRKTEQALEGLRYVRNQLGRSADPADFVWPAGNATWMWRSLPEPDLTGLIPRAQQWELSRYRAYQARLADRDVARTFGRCAEFLALAASLASASDTTRPPAGRQARRQSLTLRCVIPCPEPPAASRPLRGAPGPGQCRRR
jgi:hypothetical protein